MRLPRAFACAARALGPLALASASCVGNAGVPGSAAVVHPAVSGTVFTIVLESHDQGQVKSAAMPYFRSLVQTYGSANAYLGTAHPSLPNYVELTSGSTQGITDDSDPSSHPLTAASVADQLEAASVAWRAYMEGMGSPCGTGDRGDYAVRHDPFVYDSNMAGDTARCAQHVVDFDARFAQDLAADTYRYMWITPNLQNDLHDGTPQQADAWLARVVPQILASPGYRHGGVLFVLFDGGPLSLNCVLGTPQNLAALVITPDLVAPGYPSDTAYDHRSYLATVEDVLGLPRLATTQSATPMVDFFATPLPAAGTRADGTAGAPTPGSAP